MNEFTFISIPRTASNSIHTALNTGRKWNHLSANVVPLKGFTFAVVRNPYDRIRSWYSWHRKVKNWTTWNHKKITEYDLPIEEWISKGCPTHWDHASCLSAGFKSPLNMWEFVNDQVTVYKYENLPEAWREIQEKTGVKSDLPLMYKSRKFDLSNEARKGIRELFSKDFETFGY